MDSVYDGRERHWFYIDNAIIDEYAPKIGSAGMTVYMALVRHANGGGHAYPSLRRLEQLLGLSRPTIVKALDILQKHSLITVEHRASVEGDATSNLYTILPVGGGKNSLPRGQATLPQVVKIFNHGGQNSLPEVLRISKDLGSLKDNPPPPTEESPHPGGPIALKRKVVARKEKRTETYFPTDPAQQEAIRLLVFNEELSTWILRKGITLNLHDQWEQFTLHALARGSTYVDWRRAFMKWLTSPYQKNGTSHGGPQTSKTMDPEDFQAEAAKFKGRL